MALYVNGNNRRASYNAIYFDSFGVQPISKETKRLIRNKNIITNVRRIQAYDSITCRYFCIGFIDFMLKGKSLLDYTNLFSLNDYQKNDKKNIKIFSITKRWKSYIVLFVASIDNFKNLKYHTL